MENETEVIEIKEKNMYHFICIAQAVCVTGLLIAILTMKFFCKESFLKIKKWCNENVLEQTVITAVFDEE